MSQASFDAYNAFLLESEVDRFTKILCRYELYKQIIEIPGDIVECGVFKGVGVLFWARLIQIFNPLSPRKVIGFDTFSGVPDSVKREQDRAGSAGFQNYGAAQTEIMTKAKALGLDHRVELVPGDATCTIAAFTQARPGFRVALLNLDFDAYEPTLAALEALYDRVVPGGVVLLDEYAVHQWGESDAVDTFLKGRAITLKSFSWALSPTAYFKKPVCPAPSHYDP